MLIKTLNITGSEKEYVIRDFKHIFFKKDYVIRDLKYNFIKKDYVIRVFL